MRGIFWLILGLCVWFIPTIVFQVVTTSGNSGITAEQAVSEIPKEVVIILFAIALPIIFKGVITIRRERKASRIEGSGNSKKKK